MIRLFSPTHDTTITLGNSISEYTKSEIVLHSDEDQVYVEAKTQITLIVGDSRLYMDKSGNITLEGQHIIINGRTMVDINPA